MLDNHFRPGRPPAILESTGLRGLAPSSLAVVPCTENKGDILIHRRLLVPGDHPVVNKAILGPASGRTRDMNSIESILKNEDKEPIHVTLAWLLRPDSDPAR